MLDKSIEELKELFNSLNPKEGKFCVYCGLRATDKEHVIPESWIKSMSEMKQAGFDVEIPKEMIVPSCHECNLIASDKIFKSFREKKIFIVSKIYKKYNKFLLVKLWTDEEINELSGKLREQVFMFNEIAKIIKRRLGRLKRYQPKN